MEKNVYPGAQAPPWSYKSVCMHVSVGIYYDMAHHPIDNIPGYTIESNESWIMKYMKHDSFKKHQTYIQEISIKIIKRLHEKLKYNVMQVHQ